MIINTSKSIINKFITFNNIFSFSSKPKSYYEILQVTPQCSPKQLRSKFLKKARLLHPDHNPNPSAQQQFKILKQAYETLKDPQKRYMYDTGISVQPGQQTQMHRDFQQSGRKYYQNRWYKYSQPEYQDARDEFYSKRQQFIQQNPYRSRIILFICLIVGIFGYDYFYSKTYKKQAQNILTKQLIEESISPVDKKRTAIMKKYIDSRSKEHIVQE